jgi:putative SOS response-associated peptidase YedK
MCGRFALFASGDEVAERFQLAEAPLFDPHYSIAPARRVAPCGPQLRGENLR